MTLTSAADGLDSSKPVRLLAAALVDLEADFDELLSLCGGAVQALAALGAELAVACPQQPTQAQLANQIAEASRRYRTTSDRLRWLRQDAAGRAPSAGLVAPQIRTAAAPASYNNELGVPLTLSQLEPDTAVCLCELGTGAPGELASLCRIAQPGVGVITAIGPEHLEFFRTVQEVAAEEVALIRALPAGAPLILPQDAQLLEGHRRSDLDEWRFGLSPEADVQVLDWHPRERSADVVVSARGERVTFRTSLRLSHHRLGLAAAIAAYAALGLPLHRIGSMAAAIELSPCRVQEQELPNGGVLINDAYNANPVSMAMALEAVAARRGGGRAIVVLGEMAELGPDAPNWHAEAARHATQLGIDVLLAVGDAARRYLEGATAPLECCWLPDTTAAAEMLTRIVRPGDVVLLKGSRAACLERVAEAITRDRRARPRRGR